MPSDAEERRRKEKEYQQLLTVDGVTLPDPFSLQGWMKEEDSLDKWPPTMMYEIAEYLLKMEDKHLTKRLIGDYKEGKAYSYLDSNFIDIVSYHPIQASSALCFMK